MSYSQNDEEEAIVAFFGGRSVEARRFLDIGAHDGVRLSNTRRLAELGWAGTLVEPSPAAFVGLMNVYRGREDVKLVHVPIVPKNPQILCMSDARGDFVSTFDEAHRKVWAAPGANGRPPVPYQPIYVSAVTISMLVEVFPGPYSFVNLDVEGINLELFRELPLIALGIELVCVEYQDHLAEIETIATVQGYRRLHVTTENVLLARHA